MPKVIPRLLMADVEVGGLTGGVVWGSKNTGSAGSFGALGELLKIFSIASSGATPIPKAMKNKMTEMTYSTVKTARGKLFEKSNFFELARRSNSVMLPEEIGMDVTEPKERVMLPGRHIHPHRRE